MIFFYTLPSEHVLHKDKVPPREHVLYLTIPDPSPGVPSCSMAVRVELFSQAVLVHRDESLNEKRNL